MTAAIAGGSEAVFSEGLLRAWEAMRVVSPDVCRPFSADRRGLSLGEGAGMLVLENWEHAQARGADILAEIIGFGMSSDAHHITQPSVEGPEASDRIGRCAMPVLSTAQSITSMPMEPEPRPTTSRKRKRSAPFGRKMRRVCW